jgi:hypothetical protein
MRCNDAPRCARSEGEIHGTLHDGSTPEDRQATGNQAQRPCVSAPRQQCK